MTKKLCENISKNHENSTCLHDIDFHNILTDIYKIKNLTGVFQIDNKDVVVNAFKVNNLASGKKIISMPFSFIPKMLGESDDINGLKYLINVACTEGSEYYVEYKCFSDLGNNLTIKNKIVTKKNLLINSSLFLKNTYEEQQLEISKNLRQTIRTSNRRAQEEDIVFKKADDIRLVQSFYTMLNNMFKYKHNTISQPFEIFESVYNNFVLKNKADFYLAVKCDKVIAGIVVFKHNDNWTYMWGASDQDYSKINLNTLLVDLLIQDAIKEKAKIIDFGPSSLTNKSLIKFKQRWGCIQENIYYYYWNKKNSESNLDESYGIIRKIIPFIPSFIMKRIPKYVAPIMV